MKNRYERGLSVQLPALAGEFSSNEMSHLVEVTAQPESLAYASQAMEDYINTIRAEAQQRGAAKSDDALLALRARQREKTMEDGQ